MVTWLETVFPGLAGTVYQITSPIDRHYNCIAWAAGESHRWWWPVPYGRYYWPPGVLSSETLEAFSEAFRLLGYEDCDLEILEAGFEKIALFAYPDGFPTHAARQLPTGRWTSKLGELEDIEHDLHALAGIQYGNVAKVMKRSSSQEKDATRASSGAAS
jgi:hypothetical protein